MGKHPDADHAFNFKCQAGLGKVQNLPAKAAQERDEHRRKEKEYTYNK
jgi:hypothetical protein